MTKPELPEYLINDLAGYIARYTGLDFQSKKRRSLQKAIVSVAAELSYKNPQTFVRQLLNGSPPQNTLDLLVKHLTVGETYFFRDKYLFQLLKEEILRGLLQQPRRRDNSIRIWSAGCASGEEPYSVAILLDQMATRLRGFQVTIIGTDINPFFLDRAGKGVYTRWSFRDTPEAILSQYFHQRTPNTFEISPRIKQMVEFRRLNFVDNNYAAILKDSAPFDILLCRNVIMYFNQPIRSTVIRRLHKMVEKDGWLIVGPAETSFVNLQGLAPVRFPNAVFHRKGPLRQTATDDRKKAISNSPHVNASRKTNTASPTSGHSKSAAKRYRRKDDKSDSGIQRFDLYHQALGNYNNGLYRKTIQMLEPLLSEPSAQSGVFLMQPEAMALTAKASANLGDLKAAEYWCNAAIAAEKLNPEYYYLLASIYQADDRIAEAIKAVRQVLYLDPHFVMGHFTLAMLMRQARRPKEAIKPLENALELLAAMESSEPVPHSEGLSAGHLRQTIHSLMPLRKTGNDR